MANGAVFKLNCPVVRWDMSSPVVWHGLFLFFPLFPALKTSHYLTPVFSHTPAAFCSLVFPRLPPCFLAMLGVSYGSKSEYVNAMVSRGAGVSQQGQNQVSMDTQTCLACKSNRCTTWPQEVIAHVPDHLMAEYPTPRLVWVERATLVAHSGLQQTQTQRFPWGIILIHLCQNSSLRDNQSKCPLVGLGRCSEMSTYMRRRIWCVFCHTVSQSDWCQCHKGQFYLSYCSWDTVVIMKINQITTNCLKHNSIIKCQAVESSVVPVR